MILEYVSRKISRLRWIRIPSQENGTLRGSNDSVWICGTYGDGQANGLSIWSGNGSSGDESLQLKNHCEINVKSDVTQITPIGDGSVIVCFATGDVSLYQYIDSELQLKHQWSRVHDNCCSDAVINASMKSIVTCGYDGIISLIDIERPSSISKSKCLTQNCIQCLDIENSNEVMIGTSSGHIKKYDIRAKDVILTLPNVQSSVTCLKINPSSPHIVSCVNDSGLLSLWDMRNNAKQLMQFSAHNAMVSELHYMPNDTNIIMTSSFDGQLLRWDIRCVKSDDITKNKDPSEWKLLAVDSVMGRDRGSPINSFDINCNNEIIFSSDNEILYYGHL